MPETPEGPTDDFIARVAKPWDEKLARGELKEDPRITGSAARAAETSGAVYDPTTSAELSDAFEGARVASGEYALGQGLAENEAHDATSGILARQHAAAIREAKPDSGIKPLPKSATQRMLAEAGEHGDAARADEAARLARIAPASPLPGELSDTEIAESTDATEVRRIDTVTDARAAVERITDDQVTERANQADLEADHPQS